MLSQKDRDALRRVIVFANDKGGVGKSSLCSGIAALLAAAGYRILLIDQDPQGNLGEDLGYTTDPDLDTTALYRALVDGAPLTAMAGVRTNLDVIPSGESTHDVYRALVRDEIDRESLARALAPLAPKYDVVMIDTPPKSPEMVDLAMVAARWLIIPARADTSSRKGLSKMAEQFGQAQELNPTLELLGICLTFIGVRSTRLRERSFSAIADDFDGQAPLFATTIRHVESAASDVREYGRPPHELEEMAAQAEPWWKRLRDRKAVQEPVVASSASSLAGDYQALTQEILDRLIEAESEAARHDEGASK